jgi:putative transposase
MLILDYKLRATKPQQAAIDEAIRTTQFVRVPRTATLPWMDAGSVSTTCRRSAHNWRKTSPLPLGESSMARQAAADRAWQAIARFYKNCQEQKPGKKGDPRFQKDNRSVEYKTSGWTLEPDGKRLTFTDGQDIGTVRLIGKKGKIETFPQAQIKRVRLVRRADGYYVQFAVQAERRIEHQFTGKQVGIDVGLKAFYTDSDGTTVDNPRYLRKAEAKLSRLHRRVSRKQKRSKNRKKAIKRLAKGYLRVSRQRKDFAVKAASALCKSHDLIAYEDLKIANLVKNHRLAKSISDVSWGLFLSWVRYYGTLDGIPIIAVSPRYTTQDCSGCGFRVRKSLSMRTHLCPECGLVLDRDWNAALTIRLSALAWVAAHRTAGQAETGRSQERRNASGQKTSSGRKQLRSVKSAG